MARFLTGLFVCIMTCMMLTGCGKDMQLITADTDMITNDSNTIVNPDADSDVDSNTDLDVDSDIDSNTDLDVDSDIDSNADLDIDSDTDSNVDVIGEDSSGKDDGADSEPKTILTFIGHASVKITAKDGTTIFIDPQYPNWDYKSENADYILVTHAHDDHKPDKDLQLKEDGQLITYKQALHDGIYEKYDFGNVIIEAVPAANENHDINATVGFLVTVDDITFYHAADTSMIDQMYDLSSRDIDYAMYPIDGIYNMGPEEATEVANIVGATNNIPIHDKSEVDHTKIDRFTPEGKIVIEYGDSIEVTK